MRREGREMCGMPECTDPDGDQYFMDRLLGRCYVPEQDVIKYLVSYDGYGAHFCPTSITSPMVHRYPLDQCTWEPPQSFSNDTSKIDELLAWWTTENPGVDIASIGPHETILLHDAYNLARAGITWPGA